MNFKESEEGGICEDWEKRRKGKWCNYITISKNKRKC